MRARGKSHGERTTADRGGAHGDVEAQLRRENATLREQLAEANNTLQAMARGEVDAVATPEGPILLQAAQKELRHSRALLRAVFDGSLDGLLIADDHGTCVDANRAARGQFPRRRPDGTTHILDFNAVANVSPGLHLSALRDITDRVAGEDALRRSELRFRAMIEKGQDGIALLNADVREIYQSAAVERLLGYRLDEAQQMSWHDFVEEEERPKLASALAKLMEGPGSTASLEFRIRNGHAAHERPPARRPPHHAAPWNEGALRVGVHRRHHCSPRRP